MGYPNSKTASITNAIVKAPIAFIILVSLAVALLRLPGPVTINARDITVRQEAHVKIE